MIYGRTEKCCICYNPATNWSGWLIKSRDGVEAGYCKNHLHRAQLKVLMAERRIYNKNMGFTLDNRSTESVVNDLGLDKNLIE